MRVPGTSAAGTDEAMGGGCGELEGVQTKKGAGVWPAVTSSGLWIASLLRRGHDGEIVTRGGYFLDVPGLRVLGY